VQQTRTSTNGLEERAGISAFELCDLLLRVSNRSYIRDPVLITVCSDEVEVVFQFFRS
jgi:hypothetical protein